MYHKRFNFITLNTSEVHTSKVLLRKDAKRTLLSRLEYLDRATQNANVLKKYIEKSRKSEKVKITIFFFFSTMVFFTDTHDSQDSRGREYTTFYSTLPLPPTHEH